MRSSWPPPAPIIEHTQGTHPARESSNRIKKGKGKEMVQTPSWGRGSGGGAPGSAHIGVAVVVG